MWSITDILTECVPAHLPEALPLAVVVGHDTRLCPGQSSLSLLHRVFGNYFIQHHLPGVGHVQETALVERVSWNYHQNL